MACLKLTYNKTPELKIVYTKKGLTLKNSSKKACKHYPFGMSIGDLAVDRGADNKLKYNGKELQDDMLGGVSLNLMDFGARFMNGLRWDVIDNKAEKYYSISPYVYAVNNPILFIDPDGNEVIPVGDAEFVKNCNTAINTLTEKGVGGNLAKLQGSKEKYYIKQVSNINNIAYSAKDKTIYWDANSALEFKSGKRMSATGTLGHEAAHGVKHDNALDALKNGDVHIYVEWAIINKEKDQNDPYGSKEERQVITKDEQEIAKGLGVIEEGEVTRRDHGGKMVRTEGGPNSTSSTDLKPLEKKEIKVETPKIDLKLKN